MNAAVEQLSAGGRQPATDDLERLSPLAHQHLNFLGRYHFGLPEAVERGELRQLRNPGVAQDYARQAATWVTPGA